MESRGESPLWKGTREEKTKSCAGTEGWLEGSFREECSWLWTEGSIFRMEEPWRASWAQMHPFFSLTCNPVFNFSTFFFFNSIYNLAPSDHWLSLPPPASNHFMLSSISFCLLSASHSLSFSHSSPYGSDQGQAGRNNRGSTDKSKSLLNHCLQVLCQCLEILWIPKWSQGTIRGI